MLCPNRKRI